MEVLTVGPVQIGENEKFVARYPPTMSVMPKLTPETFYNDVEQAFIKIRMEFTERDNDALSWKGTSPQRR